MILLDTNVVFELMKGGHADEEVRRWVRLLPERPWTTAVTRAEVMTGVALLPVGARRARLAEVAASAFESLAGVLPFGDESTDAFAAIVAHQGAAGRHGEPMDAMIAAIAAIAMTYTATVATRNVKDFTGLGLRLVNPWEG